MKVSILIATYGDFEWYEMGQLRARPSAEAQAPLEVIWVHRPEATIAEVRNELVQEAEGEWLLFLDADDELAPGFLAAMDKAARMGACAGGKVLLTPQVSYVRGGKPMPPRFLDRGITLRDDNFLILGTLVQRELFMEVGGFSDYPHGFEDWSLWAKCWKAGVEIVQVPKAVYLAHVNPQSKHRLGWRDRKWQVATHERVRRELFPELYEEAS